MWSRLSWRRIWWGLKAMGNATDWLGGESEEPSWPKHKPQTHLCEGCGQERPVSVFEAVDAFIGGRHSLLVRCDDCRAIRHATGPYDNRGKG